MEWSAAPVVVQVLAPTLALVALGHPVLVTLAGLTPPQAPTVAVAGVALALPAQPVHRPTVATVGLVLLRPSPAALRCMAQAAVAGINSVLLAEPAALMPGMAHQTTRQPGQVQRTSEAEAEAEVTPPAVVLLGETAVPVLSLSA
jgi:hypothetical protein